MFVETKWLEDHLGDPGIRIVDLRFIRLFSKDEKIAEECRKDYREAHIPGAVYIDCIGDLTDPSSQEIFYVASPQYFAEVMGRAGVSNNTMVVCYDNAPYPLSSARLWWTLLYYGHTNVRILAGGLRKWIMEGRPLSNLVPTVAHEVFIPEVQDAIRAPKEIVKRSLNDTGTVLIDCLPFQQYHGKIRNPWSVRRGHIPGAVWLPPMELIEGLARDSAENKRVEAVGNDKPYPFFPIAELRKIFARVGIERGKRVIAYCGKGDAACSVLLALKIIGIEDVALYDGSLAEWTRDFSLPMECSGEKE